MIRDYKPKDIDRVMQLWLDTNRQAHHFIDSSYWQNNFEVVRQIVPLATIYVCEPDTDIVGFIGLQDNYIAGIFVYSKVQSRGIGKQLLDYAKERHNKLILQVYQKNNRAIEFYQREGFTTIKTQIDTNTNETELVMGWEKD